MYVAPPRFLALSAAVLLSFAGVARAVVIDTVVVGNPGNAPDQDFGDGQFGAVADRYRIGKHEVTNAQYAEFLNAVAATDTHALYNGNMGSDGRGGITRSGTSGSFSYSVKSNFGNKPVNFVGFWDAARFTNWLHNGQPTGAQNSSTTEDGAYTLGGVTNPTNSSVSRNAGAQWFIPTEDQWYKAAYHQPAADGGDSDDYWLYATGSNTDPTVATANATGDISNPGANVANYDLGADWNGENGNVTTVGSAGLLSDSFYGTADQAGNVWEWNEAIISSSARGVRGGSWLSGFTTDLAASFRLSSGLPTFESDSVGFRVASPFSESAIPEPASGLMVLLGTAFFMRRGRRTRKTSL